MKVAVYRFNEQYYAYANWCPHQGGPATEGIVVSSVNASSQEDYAPSQSYCIACPWHGIEFDLQSGICLADSRMRIRSYKVVVEDDSVMIE